MANTSVTPSKQNKKVKPDTQKNDSGDELDREKMISVAAYLRAEHRSSRGGDALSDWLAAEAEIDAMH